LITTLESNLAAIARLNPGLADQLRATAPLPGVQWLDTPQGVVSAVLTTASGGITLASRFRPLDEAQKLADTADLAGHAAIILAGFGLGYHAAKLAAKVTGKSMLIIYEPDVALLRTVLERIDCTQCLGHPSVLLLAGDVDQNQLIAHLETKSAYITQGVQFITHAPTRQMHGEAIKTFLDRFTKFVAFCRTHVATALVNAAVTCRNLTQNIGRYAAGATVNELHNAARGYPAVLVAAGPSLARNVHQLTLPGVRDKVVIIAAQTVLKPLLDRGVKPHFVTALDYHEISKRFYEDLPPLDDLTLVAEPKAHPAILDNFPGPIRVLKSAFLDTLLGPLARPIVPIPAGATVAHLSLYLAQHLGCDPIIMIGQDLGFSDGLYYCPGTAIHDVWAPELSPFNTLEMMEWKRIVRHKAHLQKRTDVHGRPIYSDEQMLTYLGQFERDFAAAPQKIIDATEGGMPKAHTTRMTLAEALAAHATRPLPPLPAVGDAVDAGRLVTVGEHLRSRMQQVTQLRLVTEQTLPLLREMLTDQKDHDRMERHFEQLAKQQRKAAELQAAFNTVGELNQIGAFKRLKADRAIKVAATNDPYEKQRLQLERDIENLRWLIEGCDETLTIFRDAIDRLEQQRRAGAGAAA
jgi:hypothetical protein